MLDRRFTIAFAAVWLSSVACSGGDDRGRDEHPPAESTSATATPAMAPASAPAEEEALPQGDIRIVTTNGGIDLALLGDSISSGLSPEALRKVKEETDTSHVQGTGFGADLEKMIKGTVQGAVGKRAAFPLSEVRAVRYDGERIVFEWAGEPRKIFNAKIDGKPLLASFAPEDARRFVDAVNARKGRPRHL
ncbi:MAG TPA: hypothetical protein VKA54_16135 [Gemmatimonadaceae bacterium]|nr:hypothetical protein [Gemmatimonadaceae bacterium]